MRLTATELRRDGIRKLVMHYFAILAFVVALPVTVGNLGSLTRGSDGGVVCYADGSIQIPSVAPPKAHAYDYDGFYFTDQGEGDVRKQAWVPSLFLSITLGFGNFTYVEAKGTGEQTDVYSLGCDANTLEMSPGTLSLAGTGNSC